MDQNDSKLQPPQSSRASIKSNTKSMLSDVKSKTQSMRKLEIIEVDVLVAGGGPAALGMVCNAAKTNRLKSLVTQGNGIAILEKGFTLGGGSLQKYIINSNTSADGFLQCLYGDSKKDSKRSKSIAEKKKKDGESMAMADEKKKRSNSTDKNTAAKKDDGQDKNYQETNELDDLFNKEYSKCKEPMECFKKLHTDKNDVFKMTKLFGKKNCPLSVVGMFMNHAGHHLLAHIKKVLQKEIEKGNTKIKTTQVFYPRHDIQSVTYMDNGMVMTTAMKTFTDANGKEQQTFVQFKSRIIMLANGAHQNLHPLFYKQWYPKMNNKATRERVILSDDFLKIDKYKEVMKTICEKKYKNIVIIGGSHSGFSCAWLIVNGPASYKHNNSIKLKKWQTYPEGFIHKNEGCVNCCVCGGAQVPQIAEPADKKSCACTCYCLGGHIVYRENEFDYEKYLPKHLEAGSIKIVHRDRVRVFYDTVKMAKKEKYYEFDKKLFPKDTCILYGYTGLRGDAKDMYKNIKKENRIKLISAKSPEEQGKYIQQADLVIWAAGYQTNKIFSRDQRGEKVQLSSQMMIGRKHLCQYDADDNCRLYMADGERVLTNTYGAGIAYPQRRSDGMVLAAKYQENNQKFYKYPKVDSFDLYRNTVGDQILKEVLKKPSDQKNNTINTSSVPVWQTRRPQSMQIRNAQNRMTYEVKDQYEKDGGFSADVLDIMANHRSVSNIQMLYAFGDSMFGKKQEGPSDKSSASSTSRK